MRLSVAARCALLFAAGWVVIGGGAPARAQTRTGAAPGEVIAVLEQAAPVETFVALARRRGYSVLFRDSLDGLGLEMITLAPPEGVAPEAAIVELETAAPYSVVGVNHYYAPAQSVQPRLFAEQAILWPRSGCRGAVTIGVVDTQLRAERLGLGDDNLVVASFLRPDETPSRRDHGASVAGILIGPSGLLPDATLFAAVAVMDDAVGQPVARVDHLARSINWMAENRVRVVNLSLAGPRNKIFAEVVESAAARGMILVAAVGNDGPESPPLYPAAFDGAIAVTAVDAALDIFPRAVRGPHVDIAAPGVEIWLFGADEPRYASGTSLAAPFVTARLALAAEAGAAPDVAAARALLAREAEDIGPAGRDTIFGGGLLRGPVACE